MTWFYDVIKVLSLRKITIQSHIDKDVFPSKKLINSTFPTLIWFPLSTQLDSSAFLHTSCI